jgi:hypothetical protein
MPDIAMNNDKEESEAPNPGTGPSTPAREEALADIRKHRGLVPADYKFKRSDAYEDR